MNKLFFFLGIVCFCSFGLAEPTSAESLPETGKEYVHKIGEDTFRQRCAERVAFSGISSPLPFLFRAPLPPVMPAPTRRRHLLYQQFLN